jgi:hypothetical protein
MTVGNRSRADTHTAFMLPGHRATTHCTCIMVQMSDEIVTATIYVTALFLFKSLSVHY